MPQPPSPHDPPERLHAHLRELPSAHEELRAVVARIKEYVGVTGQDERMRGMAGILLGHIDRLEKEDAEKTRSGARGARLPLAYVVGFAGSSQSPSSTPPRMTMAMRP